MIKLWVLIVFLLTIGSLSNSLAQDYTEWHLPEGAIARLGKGSINDLKLSPDGSRLAVATSIGVWLYRMHTSVEIALFNEERTNVRTVAFSPDGKTLASGSRSRNGAIQLWDIDTGAHVSTIGKGIDGVEVLAFSEDGKRLASVGWGRGVLFHVWDVNTGLEVSHFVGPQDSVNGDTLAVSPNHRFVASASRNTVFIWDSLTGTLKHTIEGMKILLGLWHSHQTVKHLLVDVQPSDYGMLTRAFTFPKLDGHTRMVRALTFSPDGKTIASGDSSGDIRLWNIAAGGNKLTLRFC